MNLIGEKVILRALEIHDNELLLELINDPNIEKMIGGRSFPVSIHSQDDWFNKQENGSDILRCAITAKDNIDLAVGTIILSDIDYINGVAHLHIKLSSKVQGKGYGTDSVNAIVDYAFSELRLHCIYAEVLSYNEASRRMFEKCGFSCDGILRSRLYKNGEYRNVHVYSVLAEDKKANE